VTSDCPTGFGAFSQQKVSEDHHGTQTDNESVWPVTARFCDVPRFCDVLSVRLQNHPFEDLSLAEDFEGVFAQERYVAEVSRGNPDTDQVRITSSKRSSAGGIAADVSIHHIPVRRRPSILEKSTQPLRRIITARLFPERLIDARIVTEISRDGFDPRGEVVEISGVIL
jgi:hypothetical protein